MALRAAVPGAGKEQARQQGKGVGIWLLAVVGIAAILYALVELGRRFALFP